MSNKENLQNKHSNINKYNIGIALLKIIMCFEVVFVHTKNFAHISNANFIIKLLYNFAFSAVPIFMILSFVFTDFKEIANDKNKFKKRLVRLLLPQILWTIIYFIIYKLLDYKYSVGLIHSNSDFLYQLFLGHAYNQTLWFQIDLIALTLVFGFVFWLFDEKKAIKISIMLGILSLFLQYSFINSRLFDNIIFKTDYLKDYITYPIGRFFEMVPFAVLGLLISYFKIFERLLKYKWFIISNSIIGILFLSIFNIFSSIPGYGYQGIKLIFMSLLLVIAFYLIPFKSTENILIKFIIQISKRTMGVYFAHRLIISLLYVTKFNTFLHIKDGSFISSIFVFIVTYIIVFLLSLIPSKTLKKILT